MNMGILSKLFGKSQPKQQQPVIMNTVNVEPDDWERMRANTIIWDFCNKSDDECGQGFGYLPNQLIWRIDIVNGKRFFVLMRDPALIPGCDVYTEVHREPVYYGNDMY